MDEDEKRVRIRAAEAVAMRIAANPEARAFFAVWGTPIADLDPAEIRRQCALIDAACDTPEGREEIAFWDALTAELFDELDEARQP